MTLPPTKVFVFTFFMISLLSLQGCALQLLNIATPSSGYTRMEDIRYVETTTKTVNPRHTLDIYEPNDSQKSNTNNASAYSKNITLIFFYGGAWDSGKKELYRFVGRAFSLEGYRVVIPDYRLYPEVQFPNFVEDSALAVKKIASLYPDQEFILIGHSAGAHIASLLATDSKYLTAAQVSPSKIKAWIGWSGPYDFLPLTSGRVKRVFSSTNNLSLTQPIHFVTPSTPPALLTHGEEDTRVLIKNSQNMAKKLRSLNVDVIEKYYKEDSHSNTLVSASTLFRDVSSSFNDTIHFLNSLP